MKRRFRYLIFSSNRYIIFFFALLFAFVSAFLIFTRGDEISFEALMNNSSGTLLYLLLLSVVYTIVFGIWRMANFSIPLKKILAASERLKRGDLSTKIEVEEKKEENKNEFDLIIDYFNSMIDELSGIETLKTDFISNVSHEIKTPLTIMQNQCALLLSDSLSDEERKEAARSISVTSQQLSEMITNILRLNKLENQEIFLAPTEFDVCEQLRQAMISFESVWEAKNIEPVLEIPDVQYIKSDSELLNLVWHNLLSNAFKYTESGSVTIKLVRDGKKVRISIIDTGCGFSIDEKDKIFDKFYQIDTSHKSSGNGLGLALVKRIADILGAQIEAESEVGKGSTFTIILDIK